MGVWIAYSYSLDFSDHFTCINYFDPSYGLKVIEFQSFNHLLVFVELNLLLNSN